MLCGGASSTAALLVRFFTERGLESERLRGTGLLSAAAHTAMYVQRRAVTCLVAEGKTEAIVAAAALLCDRRVALFQRHHTVGAPKGLRRILNALCEASVMQRIDGHLVISQLLARTLPAMHRLRVPILYVPNGVSQPEEAALLSTGHAPVAPRVAMVARMDGKKGHDCALAALARLSVRDVRLLLVGGGPGEDGIRHLADHLGIAQAVDFLGVLEDPWAVLKETEVILLPSQNEGVPLVIAEAFARSKIVVASAVGAVPELLQHRRNGFLLARTTPTCLAEALQEVLGAPASAWVQVRRNAYRTYEERCTITSSCDHLEAALNARGKRNADM